MAVSGFVKTNVSGKITLSDGTAMTPITLELPFDRGDLTISGLKEILNETVVIERRGRFVNLAHGNRVYPTFSFSCWVSQFNDSGTAPGNVLTFLQRTTGSAYAAIVSTLGSGTAVPFTADVQYDLEGTDFGDSGDHQIILNDCDLQIDSLTEAAEGISVSISGTCRGAVGGDLEMAEVA